MNELYKQNKNLADKIIIFMLFIFGVTFFFNNVITYISPFIFGYVISIFIAPIVNMFIKYLNVKRGMATALAIFVLLFFIGGIGTIVIYRIVQEGTEFFRNLPDLIYYVESNSQGFYNIFENLYEIIPTELQQVARSALYISIESLISMIGSGIKNFSTTFISLVPRVIIGIVIGLISSYFFSKDKEKISDFLNMYVPKKTNQKLKIIKTSISQAINGYFKAQFILISIVSTICVVGLTLIGAPYALFLGLIIGIVDSLPVFGSGFFFWPWIAFSFMTNDFSQAMGLSAIYVIVLLTRQILEPKIVGNQIGIHPLITLMSVYIGLRLFGFFGIFVGPCIAVVCKSVFQNLKD